MRKVDIIVDLQFGSTGKGLIAGYLAEKFGYDTVVNANMPNAGHTYINDEGRKWMHKVLPNGIVSPNLKRVMIGPGSVFSEDRLIEEIKGSKDILNGKTIVIHENASLLQDSHTQREYAMLKGISSTMQGSAAAMVHKIMRDRFDNPTVKCNGLPVRTMLFGGIEIAIVNSSQWNELMRKAENVLLEGAQGYSLGINAGFYPFCTSRDCTPSRFLADCQIPINMVRKVIGTARVHPIRVGSLPDSSSGGCYPDQEEMTWEQLQVKPETTTVTGRERRVFTYSCKQIREAVIACQPDHVFLNFCNYDEEHASWVKRNINSTLRMLGPPQSRVAYTGWGPKRSDVKPEPWQAKVFDSSLPLTV